MLVKSSLISSWADFEVINLALLYLLRLSLPLMAQAQTQCYNPHLLPNSLFSLFIEASTVILYALKKKIWNLAIVDLFFTQNINGIFTIHVLRTSFSPQKISRHGSRVQVRGRRKRRIGTYLTH